MTAPETPRERAIRLWEELGYMASALVVAEAASHGGDRASHIAYGAALAAYGAAAYDLASIAELKAAFKAGRARYRHEHPGNKP